jgi:hypothetical protein
VNNELEGIWKEEAIVKFEELSQHCPEGPRKATRNLEPEPVISLGYISMANDKVHIFCILLTNTWNDLSTALPGIEVSEVQNLKLQLPQPQ